MTSFTARRTNDGFSLFADGRRIGAIVNTGHRYVFETNDPVLLDWVSSRLIGKMRVRDALAAVRLAYETMEENYSMEAEAEMRSEEAALRAMEYRLERPYDSEFMEY